MHNGIFFKTSLKPNHFTWSPIESEEVAAGEGALQTLIAIAFFQNQEIIY